MYKTTTRNRILRTGFVSWESQRKRSIALERNGRAGLGVRVSRKRRRRESSVRAWDGLGNGQPSPSLKCPYSSASNLALGNKTVAFEAQRDSVPKPKVGASLPSTCLGSQPTNPRQPQPGLCPHRSLWIHHFRTEPATQRDWAKGSRYLPPISHPHNKQRRRASGLCAWKLTVRRCEARRPEHK